MNKHPIALTLLATWLAATLLSLLLPSLLEPTGDGFTRGLNRLTPFFWGQTVATLAAIALFIHGRLTLRQQRPWRIVSAVPLAGQTVLLLALASLIGYLMLRPAAAPASDPVTRPVTATENAIPEGAAIYYGVFRSGFEASHFYTYDGQGPWWLIADNDTWPSLQAHYVDGPGRSGGVLVSLTVVGQLEAPSSSLDHIGKFAHSLRTLSVSDVEPITREAFDAVAAKSRPVAP